MRQRFGVKESIETVGGQLGFQIEVLDNAPTNIMAADSDLKLVYANAMAKETLRGLDSEIQRLFRVGSSELLGGSIHRMHKDPARIEAILRDPRNFPHRARLRFGNVVLRAVFNVITGAGGAIEGYSVVWESVADFERDAASATEDLSKTANAIAAAAVELATNSAESTTQANTVAAGAHEMSASIDEISQNTSRAAATAARGVTAAAEVNDAIGALGRSSDEIGGLVGLIESVASQTKLLALNATIEAARAGETGKGFAVVADEVKILAQQAAGATAEISSKVTSIQESVAAAVVKLSELTGVVLEISDLQVGIASAVEEQTATSNEISRSINIVAEGSRSVNEVIGSFSEMASLIEQRTDQLKELLANE